MTCWAIIAAAGKGARAGDTPKQFTDINGRAVLWHALRPFLRCDNITHVRVITAPDAAATAQTILRECAPSPEILPVGGETRAASVRAGLEGLPDDDWALVHDAARPCLDDATLARFLSAAGADDTGGLLALPAGDTLKSGENERACTTLSRRGVYFAQTPQMFRAGALRKALSGGDEFDDESQAMEHAGYTPLLIEGEAANIKITRPQDFALAAAILSARAASA